MRAYVLGKRGPWQYIIYTPNSKFGITISIREREQGRFRASNRGSIEGVRERVNLENSIAIHGHGNNISMCHYLDFLVIAAVDSRNKPYRA